MSIHLTKIYVTPDNAEIRADFNDGKHLGVMIREPREPKDIDKAFWSLVNMIANHYDL